MHADHRNAGGAEPGDRLGVQPSQVRGNDGDRGLTGGGDGQHITDVHAPAKHRHRRSGPVQRGHQFVLPALAATGGQQPGAHPPLTRTTIGSPVGRIRTSLSATGAGSSTESWYRLEVAPDRPPVAGAVTDCTVIPAPMSSVLACASAPAAPPVVRYRSIVEPCATPGGMLPGSTPTATTRPSADSPTAEAASNSPATIGPTTVIPIGSVEPGERSEER